jgi:hypothetical protein
MAQPQHALSRLETLLMGLAPFLALWGMLCLTAHAPRGEFWTICMILGGTVEGTLFVWSCPWRITTLSWLLAGAVLVSVGCVVWLSPLLACVTSVVLFGGACTLGARRAARCRAQAIVRAMPWW